MCLPPQAPHRVTASSSPERISPDEDVSDDDSDDDDVSDDDDWTVPWRDVSSHIAIQRMR